MSEIQSIIVIVVYTVLFCQKSLRFVRSESLRVRRSEELFILGILNYSGH